MKLKKKTATLFTSVIMILCLLANSSLSIFAHNAVLDVNYSPCTDDNGGDGIDEMWYVLESDPGQVHISHEVDTIKYYFEEAFRNGSYTWTTDVSEAVAQDIKNAYANSMKKWNKIYFYSYADNGVITKHKLINVIEGTASDHNLTIYPNQSIGKIASTSYSNPVEQIETGTTNHSHYSNWDMIVYVNNFYENYFNTAEEAYVNRENTGAHEFGHVLGLSDVDIWCDAKTTEEHHHEIIMGYGEPLTDRSCNITYKDIAGVAITRGFHTDNDHKWLNRGVQEDGKYELVCSICNGVKNVYSLSGYTYDTFGACNNNHSLTSGNMFAVASYESKDYYKCKYCRYVAPFDSNVTQNYTKTYYTSALHKCVNNVVGLEYSFYEEHTLDTYVYLDKYTHRCSCACGTGAHTEAHTILASDIVDGSYYAPCMGCGYLLDLRDDDYNTIASIMQVSVNGSYILPSGIVVLVDEDVQAYLDGTLVFYHPDNLPTTQ